MIAAQEYLPANSRPCGVKFAKTLCPLLKKQNRSMQSERLSLLIFDSKIPDVQELDWTSEHPAATSRSCGQVLVLVLEAVGDSRLALLFHSRLQSPRVVLEPCSSSGQHGQAGSLS